MCRRRVPVVWILAILALAMTGCASTEPAESVDGKLRVGVLPDRSPEELIEKYRPLVEYLSASTGIEIELALPENYEELLNWFHEDRIQLAWFGGLTYVRAWSRSGAHALVMRDVDLTFTTDFLVARSRHEESLQEFADATLSFGPFLSTSGHLMPRYQLQQLGIDPETFYVDVRHSDGHDQTALWVQEGRVDVGAVNSVVVDSMLRDGRLSADLVRVIYTTAPYRNYVWAVRSDVPKSALIALQDSFLGLQANIPEHATILHAQGAGGYVPASRDDYDDLRRVADLLGLLDDGDS